MPKGGGARGVRMKVPNMSSSALQASLARMQQQAQQHQVALDEEKAEHSGVVTNVAPTINTVTGQQENYPSWFNGDQRYRSMVVYPIYINSEKSVAEGRRVPKKYSVYKPKSQEILDILTHAGYKCVLLKHKLHPKDTYKSDPCNWGRIHVEFKNADRTPLLPEIAKTKSDLLRYIGEKIPLLVSRKNAPPPKKNTSNPSQSKQQTTEEKSAPKPAPAAKRKPRKKRK